MLKNKLLVNDVAIGTTVYCWNFSFRQPNSSQRVSAIPLYSIDSDGTSIILPGDYSIWPRLYFGTTTILPLNTRDFTLPCFRP